MAKLDICIFYGMLTFIEEKCIAAIQLAFWIGAAIPQIIFDRYLLFLFHPEISTLLIVKSLISPV